MFDSIITNQMTLSVFLICIVSAMVLGVLNALVFSHNCRHSKAYSLTLAVLPAMVTLVIMMVNGNIGAGLAVAGTFALVRFRSEPGSAREIAGIFMSTSIGCAMGMGYVGLAVVYFLVVDGVVLLLSAINFGDNSDVHRTLKITVPENLDYDGVFDDILRQYTRKYDLTKVRSTNMGTLFELTYDIYLKDAKVRKEFLDAIRVRNGNLNVVCSKDSDKEMI